MTTALSDRAAARYRRDPAARPQYGGALTAAGTAGTRPPAGVGAQAFRLYELANSAFRTNVPVS